MYENLMEQIVSQENATVAWEAVKRNQGAPGIRADASKFPLVGRRAI
jgi:hypothetical protein